MVRLFESYDDEDALSLAVLSQVSGFSLSLLVRMMLVMVRPSYSCEEKQGSMG